MKTPDTIYLYRITHINNLDFIFKSQKISCQNSPDNDSNFIGIGDSTLIRAENQDKYRLCQTVTSRLRSVLFW